MAATKTTEDFPGAYSGQGRSWERMVRGQIEVLPLREGLKPKIVLQPRAAPTLAVTAVSVDATGIGPNMAARTLAWLTVRAR